MEKKYISLIIIIITCILSVSLIVIINNNKNNGNNNNNTPNNSNSDIMESPVYNLGTVFEFNNKKYLVVKKTVGIDSDSPTESPILYQNTNYDNFKKIKLGS